MKEGWEYKKLGEVAEVIHGKNQKDVLSEDGQYPIYGSGGNIMGYANDYLCEAGTTILGRKGSINNPQFIEERFWNVDTAFGISAKVGYDSKFIYYFITSINWLEKNTGTTLPSLTQQVVKSVELPIPPLSEQQSIVDYLDSAFAKIDAMKANAEKRLNEAKALFQASLKEMLEPKEGWVTSTLKDECYKITDGTHQTPKYYPSGYIFLSSRNVTSRKIDWEDVKFIDESQHQLMYKRVAPQVGDILLAKNGTTGVAAMVDRDVVFDIYVSLALLRSRGNVTPEYLLAFVNSPIAKEQFDKRLIGMGVPNLHLGEINQVVITYPQDKVEQIRMTQRIEELDCLIIRLQANYEKISQECDALKQAILRQVFE